jgi:5'-methylthioadenosine phosphorylase
MRGLKPPPPSVSSFPAACEARTLRPVPYKLSHYRESGSGRSRESPEKVDAIALDDWKSLSASAWLSLYTEMFANNRRELKAGSFEWERALAQAEIGIIGGSGLYSMPGFTNVREERVETPFGEPSDPLVLGELEGRAVAFLARHGRGHRILPSELNFRANIYAMKKLGVERILSVSAVGSLKEEHKPTDFVVPDQFIDRTFHRVSTFFGDGIVGHVAFGDPVCATVAKTAVAACAAVGVVGKLGGTYICMEGPQFSTKAESRLYRSWGADVIGMTNLQEAKLAREAEICYSTVAMVTDYDCWREGHNSVTIEEILSVLHQNAENAAKVVKAAVATMQRERSCACATAARYAVLTQPDAIPESTRERVKLLFGKYLGW